MADYLGVIIKQIDTEGARNISATSAYMQKLVKEGHKAPFDEQGVLSGSMNCVSPNRAGQLKEIDHYLNLHGNPKSTQAASHQVVSYPSGFTPSREQIERDINILLQKYGMQNHPTVWDCHTDTGNFHIHLLICRVSLVPDDSGKYLIANDGLVKKISKEKNRKNPRLRTDWAGCRQAAIAYIGEAYGWGTPQNVRMTPDGKPVQRIDPKDRHSDKTRASERKTGKKSKERQLGELAKQVFDIAAFESLTSKEPFWEIVDREFSAMAINMTITHKNAKPVGGFITGPDNRKCSFGKAGKKYTLPALIKEYGFPEPVESACVNEYPLQPFEYKNAITKEELKKKLLPVFQKANNWETLLSETSCFGIIQRSGGGLIFSFNQGQDSLKFSEISNKFSLSKLEKSFGVCPLPKTKANDAEDLLEYLAEQSVPLSLEEVPTLSQIPLFSQIKLNITRGYHHVASIIGIQQPTKPEPKQPKQPEPTKPEPRPEPRPEPKQPRPTPKPTRPTRPTPKQPEPSPSPGPSNTRNVLERNPGLSVKSEQNQIFGGTCEQTQDGNGPGPR